MKKMKDSGIEWIGDIPENWEVMHHKRVMKKIKNICEKYRGEDILSLTMRGVLKRDLENPKGKMPATFDGYQRVEEGNLLMCLFDIDVTPRCVGLIENNGLTSPAYSQFKLINNNNEKYYDYLLRMIDNDKCFLHLSKNLRSSLTETDFGMIKTIVPPIEEQKRIAEYLDKKVNEIDETIQKSKISIDEYKQYKKSLISEIVTKGLSKNIEMKNSDIEWIGKVPKHWNLIKMKYIGELDSAGVDKKIRDGERLYKSIHYTDVYKGSLKQIGGNEDYLVISATDDKYSKCMLNKGDVLFTNSSETPDDMGHSTVIRENLEDTLFGYHLMRFRPKIEMCLEYQKYLFGADYMRTWFEYCANGITRYGITSSVFENAIIILPPIEEQKLNAMFLDEKCLEIENLINKKEQLIIELENYKKSLIYECVTGKKEI